MLSWEDIINKYNIQYKIEEKEDKFEIIFDNNIKSLKNNESKFVSTNNTFFLITFNVMATRFSNFVKRTKNIEDNNECMERYNNIAKILCYFVDVIKVDFLFLQEVDTILLIIIKNIMYQFNYLVYYSNTNKKISKKINGNCIIINKHKYKIITFTIVKLTPDQYLKEDTLYSIKTPRYTLILYVNNIKTNEDIILSSVHLTGLQNRTDIRKDELDSLIKKMLTFEKKNVIICGDFNEDDMKNFNEVINTHSLILQTKDLYNAQKASSYHKWNLDRTTSKFYKEKDENIYKNLDHIITNTDYKLQEYIFYPNFKNGVYGLEVPYRENEQYNKKNWCSDHALIYTVFKK